MKHVAVMVAETIQYLSPKRGGCYFDATLGGGGHAEAVLEASSPDGRLIGCDRDPLQLDITRARLERFADRATLVRGSYERADEIVASVNVDKLDGFLIDCGGSLDQFSPEGEVGRGRGFSWRRDEPLRMTYDPDAPRTAADMLREMSETQLHEMFRKGLRPGEGGRVARAIARHRRSEPIETTGQLVEVLRTVFGPSGPKSDGRIAAVFMVTRAAVNGEWDALAEGIAVAVDLLRPGGVLAVITFHGTEVRITLDAFKTLVGGSTGPPRLAGAPSAPARIEILTGRGTPTGDAERAANPASRSARLHVARKL